MLDIKNCTKKQNQKIISIMILFVFFITQISGLRVNAQSEDNTKSISLADSSISLVSGGKAATVYIDSKGKDYNGLNLIAKSFTEDVKLVSDVIPEVVTKPEQLKGTAVIAGSIGNNEIIDSLISAGKIDVSAIKGKWECYKMQVVKNPVSGVDKAIVIVGSDKRGTIYGIYHISEMIGVSPWVYWGDVAPKKQKELTFTDAEFNITSKEPSVKYRGIFLNDEAPSLSTWVSRKFGGYNEKFYNEVFKLILRLKGNYLWPAMWGNSFSDEGISSKIANAALANDYGVVMGTSHHEPMNRAGVEWQRKYKNYGTSNTWDFRTNSNAITKFWDDGLNRNKDFENIITMGMRGEADSALKGTAQENIDLLKNIIVTQKDLLKKYNLQEAPKVLTLYSEVEKYWTGNDKVKGLQDWEGLDDITIMLCEDNHLNVRTLPNAKNRDRKAGWGLYYHFDLHGGPNAFEWVNTVPISKVWEQMTMAYDYGVNKIWIVNVGDIKPMELPTSYFLDLAYDFDKWGTNGINKTELYTKLWVKQQFGTVADDNTVSDIAKILSDYTDMNNARKPEVTYSNTYSFTSYNEAQRVLQNANDLINRTKATYDRMPEAFKGTYYQLVYYPAVASANVQIMQIYAGLSQLYASRNSVLANTYAALMKQCIVDDSQMQAYYNNTMNNGKWSGMMSSPHIGYIHWDSSGWSFPKSSTITAKKGSFMIIDVPESLTGYTSGNANLPDFTSTEKESYDVTISNGGNKKFAYDISTSTDWIRVSNKKGSVTDGTTLKVEVDWSKLTSSSSGLITIKGANATVNININAKVIDTAGFTDKTFIEAHDVVSINAEHYVNKVAKSNVEWKVIDSYGKYSKGIKMYPTTVNYTNPTDGPYLEYKVYVDEDSDYTLTTYAAPTNQVDIGSRLRYGVSFDNGAPVIGDEIEKGFVAADLGSAAWCKAVTDNIHTATTTHKLTKGVHSLRIYGIDAALVLEKFVLSNKPLQKSYFGPQESYYLGK